MERQPKVFRTEHRASFGVLDVFGHMSTQHYLNFFLEHRWEGLRTSLGLGLGELATLPYIFVIREVAIRFDRPIYGDERFEITSKVVRWEGTDSFVLCEMHKGTRRAAECTMTVTCVDKATKQAIPFPTDLIDRFYGEAP